MWGTVAYELGLTNHLRLPTDLSLVHTSAPNPSGSRTNDKNAIILCRVKYAQDRLETDPELGSELSNGTLIFRISLDDLAIALTICGSTLVVIFLQTSGDIGAPLVRATVGIRAWIAFMCAGSLAFGLGDVFDATHDLQREIETNMERGIPPTTTSTSCLSVGYQPRLLALLAADRS
jgi:hypothetical protein